VDGEEPILADTQLNIGRRLLDCNAPETEKRRKLQRFRVGRFLDTSESVC